MEDTTDETYVAMMADLTEKAQEYWDIMEKGGNEKTRLWADINFTYNYQNTTSNVTEGLGTGFSRLEQIATAYSAEESGLYHNEELKKDMISSLEWVYHTMYKDGHLWICRGEKKTDQARSKTGGKIFLRPERFRGRLI